MGGAVLGAGGGGIPGRFPPGGDDMTDRFAECGAAPIAGGACICDGAIVFLCGGAIGGDACIGDGAVLLL